ncbi:GNAT family N-acetyltransferase [Halorarius litoreus]|uniref:GNAT family N-acetyltransferase n=1 Tax=Halorarius litoreus TaxID=2962676 RepID=UPI0020CC6E21|nr:GNAT family N-acetyltransferase [Halorarius litoreus]
MYQGHFPPLGELAVVEPPPITFFDREGREIRLRTYGSGPVEPELEAIVDMYRTFDPRHRAFGLPPLTEADVRAWQEVILEGHCVLAWHGERVVGQAVLVADREGNHELAIFLHQDYHGAGIGTRLTEALLSYGRERGVDQVWLVVEGTNRPAVSLYRDVGFAVSDRFGSEVEMSLAMAA